MAEKVLLVDTNFSSRPIYDALCRRGYEVHVVGRNPLDTLAKVSDHYWQIDYSNVDALAELVASEGFDYIIPGCTDLSYSACARVSKERFPGIESSEIDRCINQKDQFRQLAKRLGLRVPETFVQEEKKLPYPLIVKPVDAFSGRGITVVNEAGDVESAIEKAKAESRTGKWLMEQYVEGQLYSHSAFIENGKIYQDFFVREDSIASRFAVDLSRICVDMPPVHVDEMRVSTERIASELSLKDGLVHIQFIVGNEGCFLIEMTRRCPGDLYSRLIEISTGYPYAESYINGFVAGVERKDEIANKGKRVIRHTVSTDKTEIFNSVTFSEELLICDSHFLYSKGQTINISHSKRVGIVFIEAASDDEAERIYMKIMHKKLYQVN